MCWHFFDDFGLLSFKYENGSDRDFLYGIFDLCHLQFSSKKSVEASERTLSITSPVSLAVQTKSLATS